MLHRYIETSHRCAQARLPHDPPAPLACRWWSSSSAWGSSPHSLRAAPSHKLHLGPDARSRVLRTPVLGKVGSRHITSSHVKSCLTASEHLLIDLRRASTLSASQRLSSSEERKPVELCAIHLRPCLAAPCASRALSSSSTLSSTPLFSSSPPASSVSELLRSRPRRHRSSLGHVSKADIYIHLFNANKRRSSLTYIYFLNITKLFSRYILMHFFLYSTSKTLDRSEV